MNYKRFVIKVGRWFIDSATAFDFVIVSIALFVASCLFFNSSNNADNFITGIIIIISSLVYFLLAVLVKFFIYLFINISDNLEIIAENTAVLKSQGTMVKRNVEKEVNETDEKENIGNDDNTFLNKRIYKK